MGFTEDMEPDFSTVYSEKRRRKRQVPTWEIPVDMKEDIPPGRSDAALGQGAKEWGASILRDFLILS